MSPEGLAPRRARLAPALRHLALFRSPVELARYLRLRSAYTRGHPSPEPLTLHLRAVGNRPLLCRGSQDVWTLRDTFVRQYHLPPAPLPNDAVIVDLGSNVGYTVAHLAHLHPRARVVGVELDEANHRLAVRNTEAFGARVTILHAGIWTSDGVVAYDGSGDDAFAIIAAAADATASAVPATSDATRRQAPALRLETLFERFGLARVDYLKMDIEGAEGAILAGPLAWAERVRALKLEVHPPVSAAWCSERLTAAGFRCRPDPAHPQGVIAERPPA
ncbi:MAG TPA: FkbM family methyltransferase [Gemmatimonadales bacterium]|nr:FkbM family methyltransferase [Gemmatimonadales bacterium]